MYLHLYTFALDARRRLAESRGQGTVEYVGIVLVVGALLLALKSGLGPSVGKDIGNKLTAAVAQAITSVSAGKG
jgi:uncharacterized protein (DUF697 family)